VLLDARRPAERGPHGVPTRRRARRGRPGRDHRAVRHRRG